MGFLTNLMTALSVVPSLLNIVDQVVVNVEQGLNAAPGISGSKKFAAAEAKVNTFLSAAITDANALAAVKDVVTPLIAGSVAAFNASGIFSHKTTVTNSPAAPQPAG